MRLRIARLKNSPYGNDEDIKSMLEQFDKSTKPVFKDAAEPSYVKFGSMRCNDPKVNIRRGQLMLSGYVFAPYCILCLRLIVLSYEGGDGVFLYTIS